SATQPSLFDSPSLTRPRRTASNSREQTCAPLLLCRRDPAQAQGALMRRFPLAMVLFAVLIWPAALWSQQSAATGSAQSGTGDAPRSAVPANAAASKTAEKDRQDQGYIDPNEPLFAPGPLPKGTVSLVGGTVESLDRI